MLRCTYNNLEPHNVSPEACAWHAERRDALCADCPIFKSLIGPATEPTKGVTHETQ